MKLLVLLGSSVLLAPLIAFFLLSGATAPLWLLVPALLFAAVSETLSEVAANPERLGAQIGFMAVLHTWTQTLLYHPHIHCIVAGGGLSEDHSAWIASRNGFFLPVRVLATVKNQAGELVGALQKGDFDVFDNAFNDNGPTLYGKSVRWISGKKVYELYQKNPSWFVTDDDSLHGTLVNGRRIAGTTRLAERDRIARELAPRHGQVAAFRPPWLRPGAAGPVPRGLRQFADTGAKRNMLWSAMVAHHKMLCLRH